MTFRVNDFLGREVSVGDVITYPTRQGSDMSMRLARVVGIKLDRQYGQEIPKLSVEVANGVSDQNEVITIKKTLVVFDRIVRLDLSWTAASLFWRDRKTAPTSR